MWQYPVYNGFYGGQAPSYAYQQQRMQYYQQQPYASSQTDSASTRQRRLSDQDQHSTPRMELPRQSSFFSNGSGGGGSSYYGGGTGSFYNTGGTSSYGDSFYGLRNYDSTRGGSQNSLGLMRVYTDDDFYDDNKSRTSVTSQQSSISNPSTRGAQSSLSRTNTSNQDDDRNFSRLVRKKSTLHRNMDSDDMDTSHKIGRSKRITLIGEEIL